MHIDEYAFGCIVIDGNAYEKDVLLFGDSFLHQPWWRHTGHSLCLEDLNPVAEKGLQRLLIGTGAQGALRVPKTVKEALSGRGVKLQACKTPEAIARWNGMSDRNGVAAGLHLTC